MKQENVVIFNDKEDEFVNLLTQAGIKRPTAQVLVFLSTTPIATSRDLERGTDLRQPEVSIAIKYMNEQGWIKTRDVGSEKKGRPMKSYSLAIPVKGIIAVIEKMNKDEATRKLDLIKKMKDYLK